MIFKKITQTITAMEDMVSGRLSSVEEKLSALDRRQEEQSLAIRSGLAQAKEAAANAESRAAALAELGTSMERQGNAIEDMLEEWDDLHEDLGSLLKEAADQKPLLALCESYEEQFALLRRAFADDPDWKKQLAMMDSLLESRRLQAGFHVIGDTEVPVDYALHEVVSVALTEDEAKNGLVQDVLQEGFAYKGKILKKARVTAYKTARQA